MNSQVKMGVFGTVVASALLIYVFMPGSPTLTSIGAVEDQPAITEADCREQLEFANGNFARGMYERAQEAYARITAGSSECASVALWMESRCFAEMGNHAAAQKLREAYIDKLGDVYLETYPDEEWSEAFREAADQ